MQSWQMGAMTLLLTVWWYIKETVGDLSRWGKKTCHFQHFDAATCVKVSAPGLNDCAALSIHTFSNEAS